MSKIEENVAWENMYSALFYAIVDEERYDEASLLELEREFIFHMSDAIPELKQLSVTFASSDLQNVEACGRMLYVFLRHGLNHLEMARRCILPDSENPFLQNR